MSYTSVTGYPRIGRQRELKNWVEAYLSGRLPRQTLFENAARLRKEHWAIQREKGVHLIPSNDFSFYDNMLDTAVLINAIPRRYRELGLGGIDTYFAAAKGYQAGKADVTALSMKKWFNTNYHYMVPIIEKDTAFALTGEKPFNEYGEALEACIETKPVLIGPFTFLHLSKNESGRDLSVFADAIAEAYGAALARLSRLGAEYIQMDEPYLVRDLSAGETDFFCALYQKLLRGKGRAKIILQTYFGDMRDAYQTAAGLDFDGIGMDFVEGRESLPLVLRHGFPKDKLLVAGVVSGRNIWKNDLNKTLELLRTLSKHVDAGNIVPGTSCSLLHVPHTVADETQMDANYREHFAFAEEKLAELALLDRLFRNGDDADGVLREDERRKNRRAQLKGVVNESVRRRTASLAEADFTRKPRFEDRIALQKQTLNLPPLPTTTIGSFPQTGDIRRLRREYKDGAITEEQYKSAIFARIADVIALQEKLGLDVLVHGEFERNDMVEYFGENLEGFLFTQNGWVQSYGTRCVKPPVIFGDVERTKPITPEYIIFAQSRTAKPVKGMLTGPVTILNWSFAREDLPQSEIAMQIALAIRGEVMELEQKGIRIIQIDEAALREKLPLKKSEWKKEYLDWAIRAFRLVHSGVKPETQIHTHMCYSEFSDLIREIESMDADVITFEAARSDFSMLDVLKESGYRQEVGLGVYDIHSPRIPPVREIAKSIEKVLGKLERDKVWVNPDCGLKTRTNEEAVRSLENMVQAAARVRAGLDNKPDGLEG